MLLDFECFADTDEIKLSEDHDNFLWIDPKEYKKQGVIETNHPAFEDYLSKKM